MRNLKNFYLRAMGLSPLSLLKNLPKALDTVEFYGVPARYAPPAQIREYGKKLRLTMMLLPNTIRSAIIHTTATSQRQDVPSTGMYQHHILNCTIILETRKSLLSKLSFTAVEWDLVIGRG
jgi:hypothetical protein